MNKKQLILTSLILLTANIVGLWQYIQIVNLDAASAVTANIPNPGQTWASTECSATSLCIVNNNLGIAMGASKNPINNLDVNGSVAIGTSYAGVNTAPTNGLIVQGKLGVGTINPGAALEVNGSIYASGGDVCSSSGACLSQVSNYLAAQPLIGNIHTYGNCTSGGGVVTSVTGADFPLCRFAGGSCPSGWTQYRSWGTLGGGCQCIAGGYQYCGYTNPGCGSTYPWQDRASDVFTGSSGDKFIRTYSEIGCY